MAGTLVEKIDNLLMTGQLPGHFVHLGHWGQEFETNLANMVKPHLY